MAEALDSAERTFEIRNNNPSHRASPKSQGGEEQQQEPVSRG
jgi:hypothetical protein